MNLGAALCAETKALPYEFVLGTTTYDDPVYRSCSRESSYVVVRGAN